MEEMIANRVTPTIKCMMLFLLIFTAKVLTSRPQENLEESKNSIHQSSKPAHYVRTFTKYHHRRTQWNSMHDASKDWPVTQDQPKVVAKRSVDTPNSKELMMSSGDIPILNQFSPDTGHTNVIGPVDKNPVTKDSLSSKNNLSGDMKKFKIKAAMVVTDPPTTVGPSIYCLYKIYSVSLSVTPSYDDDKNADMAVETDHIDTPGVITDATLPSGERARVERCTDPRAACYTLYHRENMTVLGQGCWHSSQDTCNKCTEVLPNTKFCCCTTDYCNGDFLSLPEEIVTPRAIKTIDTARHEPNYSNIVAAAILAIVAILVMGVAFKKMYCTKPETDKDVDDGADVEKGDVMGSGPDALATGLSCVDNLTLIEHIGAGRYGSVWRGTLGAMPVAVKLYNNASTWQKEADIYSMPHIKHPNILKYYGSDTRPTLTGGGRDHLLVLELCDCSLRQRLHAATLEWHEFATLAHDVASALAHLHSSTPTKPCVVHRDINSNNVLVKGGRAKLADLGLAHPDLRTNIAEAGTLRYLAPEALEGALDLSGARAALSAVDVFALGLLLWEMLWRTRGAHPGPVPAPAPPYHHLRLPARPSLATMQSIVSRKKARPPLPKGPVKEWRALKIACDTCEECWDHDAEARLTAVCVEERMSELKQILNSTGPIIHDNNLHAHNAESSHPEPDKNSNCLRASDPSAPLLPPTPPSPTPARNLTLERNTDIPSAQTVTLIHKSLKDVCVSSVPPAPRLPNLDEPCLSVARGQRRIATEQSHNEIRSYPRPLDYVPNDIINQNDYEQREHRPPKQTNLLRGARERPKWGIKRFFGQLSRSPRPLETEVKLVQESLGGSLADAGVRTSLVQEKMSNLPYNRPSNIVLNDTNLYNTETPCLSPPNRTLSPTMILESDLNRENKVFGFKELPPGEETGPPNQIFAVIVPKGKPADYKSNLIEMRSKTSRGSSESLTKNSVRTSMSAQSIFATAGHSESEDSTVKKRLSCDNKVITASGSDRSSRASINLELQYIENRDPFNDSPFDLNTDCSSSEDEQLMLLSEGSKITMQTIARNDSDRRKPNEVLKETTQKTEYAFNKNQNKYSSFDNEYSDPNDKENLLAYSGDNPVYLAALNGEIDSDFKAPEMEKSPKPALKNLAIKRQHSLEQVSEIFTSSGDVHLLNPAGRVKTPGDIPVAVRRARRDKALQKGRGESNRLSLYDDRMMFGNSL